jgi:hypothetical protein
LYTCHLSLLLLLLLLAKVEPLFSVNTPEAVKEIPTTLVGDATPCFLKKGIRRAVEVTIENAI